jgi:hypothetical protein
MVSSNVPRFSPNRVNLVKDPSLNGFSLGMSPTPIGSALRKSLACISLALKEKSSLYGFLFQEEPSAMDSV